MSKRDVAEGIETGFWRLPHDHLAAALARRDLSGEQLRVYLAMADLTRGYGRERDTISISQIAERAGHLRRPHVVRALHVLTGRGLYGQAPMKGQALVRWVVWPPPAVPDAGKIATTVPTVGNTTVPVGGNRTVPKGVPSLGKHQDTKKGKKNTLAADPRVKEFLSWFGGEFQKAFGRTYVTSHAKDGSLVKRLLRQLDAANGNGAALAELQAAARRMLADSWGRERASIGILSSQINQWRGQAPTRRGYVPAPAQATIYATVGKNFDDKGAGR